MSLQPIPVSLDDLSTVRMNYSLVRTHRGRHWDILIIRFTGRCRPLNEGELDDRYMHAMAAAGAAAWEPAGIILDLSGLESGPAVRCDWVFGLGDPGVKPPLAIVVGPASEETFREDLDLPEHDPSCGDSDWIYRDLDSALAYVDREVEEAWSDFCGPAAARRREAASKAPSQP